MLLLWVSLVLFSDARSAQAQAGDARLATAALASPRPRECRAASDDEGLWLRARAGGAERYCELLARGYARLAEAPQAALEASRAAEALAGPLPAVLVLAGRAQLGLGQGPLAFELFVKAEAQDGQAFVDPKALHAFARAASLAGKSADALRLYRLLVSRSALLDDAREATVVQIEAAAHALADTHDGADEALGYLAQARRESLGLSPLINALRALARERSGHADHASAESALPSVSALEMAVSGALGAAVWLPAGQLEQLRAMLQKQTATAAGKVRAR